MPPSSIFQSFKKANCVQVRVWTSLSISRTMLARLQVGKRKKTIWFGTAYPGEGKFKIGVAARLKVTRANFCELFLKWFLTELDPPETFQEFATLLESLDKAFGEREVEVQADFSFDKEKIISLFTPIDVASLSPILSEIVGFTGVKRDPTGKLLYRLEITVSDKTIEQNLNFKQTVMLGSDMPIPILATASRVSALAVKPKEST